MYCYLYMKNVTREHVFRHGHLNEYPIEDILQLYIKTMFKFTQKRVNIDLSNMHENIYGIIVL